MGPEGHHRRGQAGRSGRSGGPRSCKDGFVQSLLRLSFGETRIGAGDRSFSVRYFRTRRGRSSWRWSATPRWRATCTAPSTWARGRRRSRRCCGRGTTSWCWCLQRHEGHLRHGATGTGHGTGHPSGHRRRRRRADDRPAASRGGTGAGGRGGDPRGPRGSGCRRDGRGAGHQLGAGPGGAETCWRPGHRQRGATGGNVSDGHTAAAAKGKTNARLGSASRPPQAAS